MSDWRDLDVENQLAILKQKFARGEITKKEYEALKKEIEAASALANKPPDYIIL